MEVYYCHIKNSLPTLTTGNDFESTNPELISSYYVIGPRSHNVSWMWTCSAQIWRVWGMSDVKYTPSKHCHLHNILSITNLTQADAFTFIYCYFFTFLK